MKKSLILSLCLLISNFFLSNAQALKFGHVNSAELLKMMPGVKEADTKLQEYVKQLEQQSQAMIAEYQSKMQEYQKQEAMMADAVKEVKAKEISDLETRIQSFQQSAQEKISNKKEELLSPIIEKVQKAITDVAKENKYSYIFDSSAGGSIVYAQDSDNVLDLVKKKIGIQ